MPYSIQKFLVNGSAGDPALYVGMGGPRGSLLFDCGDLMALSAARLHRVQSLFISHAHMDHFFGFDWFLRSALGKDHAFTVYGPPGITRHVRGKLEGYLWNIAMDFRLEVTVAEVRGERLIWSEFACEHGLETAEETGTSRHDGCLEETPHHRVTFTELDHDTPSLAFAFEQKSGVHFDRDGLRSLGLQLGDWMKDLEIAYRCDETGPFKAGDRTLPMADLRPYVSLRWGTKLAYVADTRFSDEVFERTVSLARESDILYCAAKFLSEDRDKAEDTAHLTAEEAGRIARAAEVEELVLFHPSKSYHGRHAPLLDEARAVYDGSVRMEEEPAS